MHLFAEQAGKVMSGPALIKEVNTLRKFLFKNQEYRFTEREKTKLFIAVQSHVSNPAARQASYGKSDGEECTAFKLLEDALKMPFSVFSTAHKKAMLKWYAEILGAEGAAAKRAAIPISLSVVEILASAEHAPSCLGLILMAMPDEEGALPSEQLEEGQELQCDLPPLVAHGPGLWYSPAGVQHYLADANSADVITVEPSSKGQTQGAATKVEASAVLAQVQAALDAGCDVYADVQLSPHNAEGPAPTPSRSTADAVLSSTGAGGNTGTRGEKPAKKAAKAAAAVAKVAERTARQRCTLLRLRVTSQ